MTDYLELLLEAEEDEEEAAVEWETPVILGLEQEQREPAERAAPPGQQMEEMERRSGGRAAPEPLTGVAKHPGSQALPVMPAKGMETADRLPFWGQTTARTGGKGLAGGALTEAGSGTRLYQRVTRLRRVAETARGENRGTERTVVVRQENAPGLTVEGIDRAVQRDARRYDGGFGLY